MTAGSVPSVLVAGIGNIFFRDDGFGPAVVSQLQSVALPEGVRVIDYGIRGLHLSYDLLDGVDALIVVDAVPGPPDTAAGTVLTLEIDPDNVGEAPMDAHSLSPAAVFARVDTLGGRLPLTYIVGCVPADVDEGIGLSEPVTAAVLRGAAAVLGLIESLVPQRVGVSTGRAGE